MCGIVKKSISISTKISHFLCLQMMFGINHQSYPPQQIFFCTSVFSSKEKGGTNISMWMLSKTSQTLLTKRSPKFHYFSTYRFPFSFHTQQLFQKCDILHLVKGSLTRGRGIQWIIYPTPVSRHERKGISQGMWTDDFFCTSCKPWQACSYICWWPFDEYRVLIFLSLAPPLSIKVHNLRKEIGRTGILPDSL